jgi:hypothetical protein
MDQAEPAPESNSGRRVLVLVEEAKLRDLLLAALDGAGYEGCTEDELDVAKSAKLDRVLLEIPLDGDRVTSLHAVRTLSAEDVSQIARGTAVGAQSGDLDLRRNVERLERRLILRALVITRGNRAHAARLLGIRRALLYARLKTWNAPDDEDRTPVSGEWPGSSPGQSRSER